MILFHDIVEILDLADGDGGTVLFVVALDGRFIGRTGIRLRRDNGVSVRYAEELNSGKSSVILQRADRHGILGQKSADFQVSV